MKPIEPVAVEQTVVCKESWWVGCDRATFTQRQKERQAVLSPVFGSAPVSLVPSAAEQTFMDRKR